MDNRKYLVCLADKSSFYITSEDFKKAVVAYNSGDALFIRGRLIANHLISQIRACSAEENKAASEELESLARKELLNSGKRKIIEERDESGELTFKMIDTTNQLNANSN